ncbi:dTMP kinase [Candidatus Mycoplasma pogonae]
MFITFEGLDGSGKSSVITAIVELLKQHFPHHELVITHEPGGSGIPENKILREFILNPEYHLSPITEAVLFAASRRIHLEKLIWPSLKANKIVICDRFVDSSLAYQSERNGITQKQIWDLNDFVTEKSRPNLTFLLKLTPEVSRQRLLNGSQGTDRIESKDLAYFQKTAAIYDQLAIAEPQRFVVIDASLPFSEVVKKVWQKLQIYLIENSYGKTT